MVNGGVVGKGIRVERVGRAKIEKGAGIGAREIKSIRMDAQDHVGSPIDLATIRVGRDETKVETRDGARVGAACSVVRAQVAVRMRASTLRP